MVPGSPRPVSPAVLMVQVMVTPTLPPRTKLLVSTLTLIGLQVRWWLARFAVAVVVAASVAACGFRAMDAARAAEAAVALRSRRVLASRRQRTTNVAMIAAKTRSMQVDTDSDPRSVRSRCFAKAAPSSLLWMIMCGGLYGAA